MATNAGTKDLEHAEEIQTGNFRALQQLEVGLGPELGWRSPVRGAW